MDDAGEDTEIVEPVGDFDDFEVPSAPDVTDSEPEELDASDEEEEDEDNEEFRARAPEQVVPLSGQDSHLFCEIYVLPPDECMTSDFLEPNEVARVLSVRAEQIARTNDVFLPKGVARASYNPVELAKQELRAGMCPLIVQRVRGKNVIEEHRVRDLLLLGAI
jgi:DNA-directed RNA polymerase subunit K/omega